MLFVWGTNIYEDEKDCKAADFIPESSPASDILKSIPGAAPPAPLIFREEGEILEKLKAAAAVLKAVKHQDRLLSVTHDPKELRPHMLVPLSKPARSSFRGI